MNVIKDNAGKTVVASRDLSIESVQVKAGEVVGQIDSDGTFAPASTVASVLSDGRVVPRLQDGRFQAVDEEDLPVAPQAQTPVDSRDDSGDAEDPSPSTDEDAAGTVSTAD